jgi:hypothetical protein
MFVTFATTMVVATTAAALDWSSVEEVLSKEVSNGSFPGAVALVIVGDEAMEVSRVYFTCLIYFISCAADLDEGIRGPNI